MQAYAITMLLYCVLIKWRQSKKVKVIALRTDLWFSRYNRFSRNQFSDCTDLNWKTTKEIHQTFLDRRDYKKSPQTRTQRFGYQIHSYDAESGRLFPHSVCTAELTKIIGDMRGRVPQGYIGIHLSMKIRLYV